MSTHSQIEKIRTFDFTALYGENICKTEVCINYYRLCFNLFRFHFYFLLFLFWFGVCFHVFSLKKTMIPLRAFFIDALDAGSLACYTLLKHENRFYFHRTNGHFRMMLCARSFILPFASAQKRDASISLMWI